MYIVSSNDQDKSREDIPGQIDDEVFSLFDEFADLIYSERFDDTDLYALTSTVVCYADHQLGVNFGQLHRAHTNSQKFNNEIIFLIERPHSKDRGFLMISNITPLEPTMISVSINGAGQLSESPDGQLNAGICPYTTFRDPTVIFDSRCPMTAESNAIYGWEYNAGFDYRNDLFLHLQQWLFDPALRLVS